MEAGDLQHPTSESEQWPRQVGPRGWTPPPLPPGPAGGASATARARTGLIIAAALVTELIVIAAADNQWVSDKIVHNELRTNNVALRSLANSWLTYTWRLSPRDGTNANQLWGSQLALVLTVLVLTGLLVAAVVRGPITFGRAFFGTWMAVIVATLAGGFVRGLIEPFSKYQMQNSGRVTRAAFGPFGINQSAVAAGFGLGLFVALVTGIVAVTTRRAAAPVAGADPAAGYAPYAPPYQQPEQPPPYYGDGEGHDEGHVGGHDGGHDEAATTQLPPAAAPAPDDATTRYRPIDEDEDLGPGPEPH